WRMASHRPDAGPSVRPGPPRAGPLSPRGSRDVPRDLSRRIRRRGFVMASMTVIRSGMLTTVQHLERWGQQHLKMPVAGPMDWYSHRLANGALGNAPDAAALEITLMGPDLVSDADVLCAVAGAEFDVTAGDRRVRWQEPFLLHAGERL